MVALLKDVLVGSEALRGHGAAKLEVLLRLNRLEELEPSRGALQQQAVLTAPHPLTLAQHTLDKLVFGDIAKLFHLLE